MSGEGRPISQMYTGWLIATVAIAVIGGLGQVTMRGGGRGVPLRDLVSVHGVVEHPWWWLGLLVCWICGLAWAWVVTRIPLGLAVPVYTGTFFIAVALGSSSVLDEGVGFRHWIGFLLIALGIATIVSAKPENHPEGAPYTPVAAGSPKA